MNSAFDALPLIPPESASPVLVGFSGGLDSSVLLHRLTNDPTLRTRGLRAMHVHHGLQAEADRWQAHCEQVCAGLGIPLQVARVQVVRDGGIGLEAAARQARHEAFTGALQAGDTLALAHHLDDQAETFLLRALRASGVDGLAAMRPWRPYASGWLWRPLLDQPRARLLAYAHRHGLHWIEDPSNASDEADRNFLRNRVMPLLRERWPHAAPSFARTAALQADAANLLAAEDAADLAAARGHDPACLHTAALLACPSARRARLLRHWIATLALPPLPATGIERIERDLLVGDDDRIPAFVWNDTIIRHWRGRLWAERQRPALPADLHLEWNGNAALALPTGDQLHLEGDTGFACEVIVHARQGGERIVLPGRTHSHALKHVLQSLDLPPWQRPRMPLLSDANGQLLAAGDVVFSAAFDAWLKAGQRHLHWQHT